MHAGFLDVDRIDGVKQSILRLCAAQTSSNTGPTVEQDELLREMASTVSRIVMLLDSTDEQQQQGAYMVLEAAVEQQWMSLQWTLTYLDKCCMSLQPARPPLAEGTAGKTAVAHQWCS